ncbi:hypothetical protein J6590_029059 [Homalodisca vitripennis]|nr:hypothetical protein J6590_029059 [Homalodisca vitripennis]
MRIVSGISSKRILGQSYYQCILKQLGTAGHSLTPRRREKGDNDNTESVNNSCEPCVILAWILIVA